MSLINMAAAITPPQNMTQGQALQMGQALQQNADYRKQRENFGPGGAQAFGALIGRAADWADTPEKWTQAQAHLSEMGVPNADRFGFEQREILRGFYGKGPEEQTALQQHISTVNQMVQAGRLTPEQGQAAILSKLGVSQGQKDRKIISGADGYQYYADSGQRVLPNVNKPPEDRQFIVTGEQATQFGLDPNFSYNVTQGPGGFKASKIGGGDTNISTTLNTGDTPDARPIVNKPQPGFQRRWDPDKNTWVDEAIPGSQPALDAQEIEDKTAAADRNKAISNTVTMRSIDASIAALEGNTPVTGPIGAMGGLVPGTPQADHKVRISQITDAAALDEIARMRKTSPTGGAVGSLTDGERVALGNAASGVSSAQSREAQLAALRHYKSVLTAYANGEWGITEDGKLVGTFDPSKKQSGTQGSNTFVVDGVTVTRK